MVSAGPGWIIFNAEIARSPVAPLTKPCIAEAPENCVDPWLKKSIVAAAAAVAAVAPVVAVVGGSIVVAETLGDDAGEDSVELHAGITRDSYEAMVFESGIVGIEMDPILVIGPPCG